MWAAHQIMWRRDEYKDKLSGELLAVEVLPIDDLQAHGSSEDCACLPELKHEQGVPMLIHNAFDGRELTEANERGH